MTPLRLVLVAVIAAAALLAAPGAQAAKYNCKLRFDSIGDAGFNGSGGRGYDPFAASNGLTAIEFTVRSTNGNGCPFFVTVSTGQSGSYDRRASSGSETLRYNVYGGASAGDQPLRDIGDATPSTVLGGTIAGKETNTLRYYLDVPSMQVVGQGSYSDTVEFGLFAGSPSDNERADNQNVKVTVPVIPVIDVEIAAGGVRVPLEGASVVLDFGNLEPRESRDFNLYVRGNAPYRIEIVSQNGGLLRLEESASDHNTIPYSLEIDGSSRTLNGPVLLSYGTVTSGARQHRGAVVIGDFDTVLRGTYSDVLTVSVTAN